MRSLLTLLILALTTTAASAELIGARISSEGTCQVVALFAQFADEDRDVPSWGQNLFDPDLPGSFAHYYTEMSLGRFTVRGETIPASYTSERSASEYMIPENDTGYFGTFNLEVLRKADQDIDFGRFDNDGRDGVPNSGDDDGYVDFLFVLVESTPAGFLPRNASGAAKLGLEEDFITDDPTPSGYIRIASELGSTQKARNRTYTVGTMAHEFGHVLGLPELYDRFHEGPEDDSAGIGNWGIMGRGARGWNGDDGPAPLSAWSREQLGWVDAVEITGDVKDLVMRDVATTGTVYRIPLSEERGYYLLENRQSAKSHYDRGIPRDGLLVWHVRSQVRFPRDPNAEEEHKGVDLVCADGLYLDRGYPEGMVEAPGVGSDNLDFWAHDEYATYRDDRIGNLGDATDVFDGIDFTEFTPQTNPRSREGIRIESIRRRGTDMVANFHIPSWSGEITEDVTWEVQVNVAGDLVVQEGVTLTIHSGTVVRFSPRDVLKSGTDPERCEIEVLGSLRITVMGNTDPVRFTAGGRGTWVGVRLHEGTAGFHWYGNPEIRVEDCDHPRGIFWAEHPEATRPEVSGYTVQDEEALRPGETTDLVLDVRNWTRRRYEMSLSTADSFVVDPQRVSFGTLVPGSIEPASAAFTVAPTCPDGHRIAFTVTFTNRKTSDVWTDTLSLLVEDPGTKMAEERYDVGLATPVEEAGTMDSLPISVTVGQNYPNPFNAETVIPVDLPRSEAVTLTVFDALGQRIKVREGNRSAGQHSITWDGQDEYGRPVASGVYVYRVEADGQVELGRMMLVR